MNLRSNKNLSPEQRFLLAQSTPVGLYGCRLWLGHRDKDGYGTIVVNSKRIKAHRFAYIQEYGEIPEGCVIDHYICDNPSCVEVSHLKATSQKNNTLRSEKTITGKNSRKTHCPKGHFYEEHGKRDSAGRRICYICRKEQWTIQNRKHQKNKIFECSHGSSNDIKMSISPWCSGCGAWKGYGG